MEIQPLIAEAKLSKVVIAHSAAHFLRRLANLGPAGLPPSFCGHSQIHRFVMSVQGGIWSLQNAYRDSSVIRNQVRVPPPTEWLARVGQSNDCFRQMALDHFTTILYSALDRTLHIVNEVCHLGRSGKNCNYRSIQEALKAGDPLIGTSIERLRTAVAPLSDARHFFLHRGDNRHVGVFSDLRRMRLIDKAFSQDQVVVNDEAAVGMLVKTIEDDLLRVAHANRDTLDSLCCAYARRVRALGGIDFPSPDEIHTANEVIASFKAGTRPPYLAV